jgi:hypothetical protein
MIVVAGIFSFSYFITEFLLFLCLLYLQKSTCDERFPKCYFTLCPEKKTTKKKKKKKEEERDEENTK